MSTARSSAAPAPAEAGPQPPLVAASILSADFSRLDEALAIVDPRRDWVHCDVMDNHFVPNLTFGPLIVEAVRRLSSAHRDVHLMIEHPERLVAAFRAAGADRITVHLEACAEPGAVLEQVRSAGARAGLALRPGTALSAAEPFLSGLDLLLVMTVEPGFGGQAFMPDMLDKVRAARDWRRRHGGHFLIEVDGGIGPATAPEARAAGADVFVAGHAVYGEAAPMEALARLRRAVGAG